MKESQMLYNFDIFTDEKDYIEFSVFNFFNSPVYKRRRNFIRYGYSLMFIMFACLFIILDGISVLWMIYLLGGIAWLVFFKQIYRRTIKANVKRMKKFGKLPCDSVVTMSFFDDYFVEVDSDYELKIKYSAIERVALGESAIYLYRNVLSAYVITHRVFADEISRNEFIEFIKSKTSKTNQAAKEEQSGIRFENYYQ